MRFSIPLPQFEQARTLLRRAGYAEFHDRNTGETSYTRRLGQLFFPKYHVYPEEREGQLIINIHLDQKQASYAGSHAHSGEYDGDLVEREAARLQALFTSGQS
ncbi:hypothetical protein HY629_01340 [Candidatus Uhrbacteria bacterium]|nr:hypothetical protein [Candidatus Uhrbacteria bacterium]